MTSATYLAYSLGVLDPLALGRQQLHELGLGALPGGGAGALGAAGAGLASGAASRLARGSALHGHVCSSVGPAPGVAGWLGSPGSPRAWGSGSPVSDTRARGGCHSAGTGVTGAPASALRYDTLPSASHFCETPPDLRFLLGFPSKSAKSGRMLVTALQEAGATARYPGHPRHGKSLRGATCGRSGGRDGGRRAVRTRDALPARTPRRRPRGTLPHDPSATACDTCCHLVTMCDNAQLTGSERWPSIGRVPRSCVPPSMPHAPPLGALLHRYSAGSALTCEPVEEGLLNRGFRLRTTRGRYFLKHHFDPDTADPASVGPPAPGHRAPGRSGRPGRSPAARPRRPYGRRHRRPRLRPAPVDRGPSPPRLPELTPGQCGRLGALLGVVHASLEHVMRPPAGLPPPGRGERVPAARDPGAHHPDRARRARRARHHRQHTPASEAICPAAGPVPPAAHRSMHPRHPCRPRRPARPGRAGAPGRARRPLSGPPPPSRPPPAAGPTPLPRAPTRRTPSS